MFTSAKLLSNSDMETFKLLLSSLLFLTWARADNSQQSRPNIVFVLADDLGWDDVGFHGSPDIPTPNIDTLAYDGIILKNNYVQPICTPSRSALMTGRHPIHTGLQHEVIVGSEPYGLGLDEKILPQYLKEIGYDTHIVGKWHLGLFAKSYLPLQRGFDSHYGYYQGCEDYYDHTYVPDKKHANSSWGLDFRDNETLVKTAFGQYSTELFTKRAEEIIEQHNPKKPMFMYLAQQAVHSGNPVTPLEAPWKYVKKMQHIKSEKRRIFAGMLSALDDSIGNVTKALQKKGMLNNTIIVFSTDNGGPAAGFDLNMACNFPLRGLKSFLWEGGVRGPGFIWSPLLQTTGYQADYFFQIFDWLPTLLSAAGYNMSSLPSQIDGMDMWNVLSTKQEDGPRVEMLHNIDPVSDSYAFRRSDMKIIYSKDKGTTQNGGWYKPGEEHTDQSIMKPALMNGVFSMSRNDAVKSKSLNPDLYESDLTTVLKSIGRNPVNPLNGTPFVITCGPKPANASTNCQPSKSVCLFNITADPCEYNNLASQHPEMVAKLQERLEQHRATMVKPRNKPQDPKGFPEYHDWAWGPWINDTDIL